jgi:hypothetical protein
LFPASPPTGLSESVDKKGDLPESVGRFRKTIHSIAKVRSVQMKLDDMPHIFALWGICPIIPEEYISSEKVSSMHF